MSDEKISQELDANDLGGVSGGVAPVGYYAGKELTLRCFTCGGGYTTFVCLERIGKLTRWNCTRCGKTIYHHTKELGFYVPDIEPTEHPLY